MPVVGLKINNDGKDKFSSGIGADYVSGSGIGEGLWARRGWVGRI
jgi:hypothetical protein